MITLYLAQDLTDARLLLHRLERHAIKGYIRNESLQGALGELPLTVRPEVCILERGDWARASVIKEEYERARRTPVSGEDRGCSQCGELSPSNFELCWKCGRELPEA